MINNTTRRFMSVIIMMIMTFLLIGFSHIYADEELYRYGSFTYRIENNEVVIHEYDPKEKNTLTTIVIPDVIEGMKVVDVDDYAFETYFSGAEKVKKIKCSAYMKNVRMMSFTWLSKLDRIRLGKYTESFDPENNCRGNVTRVAEVIVPKGNRYLKTAKNGGLYSKDGKTLYFVPNLKKGRFTVSSKTETIYKNAFYYSKLKKVKLKKKIKKIQKNAFCAFDVSLHSYEERNWKGVKKICVPSSRYKRFKRMLKRAKTPTDRVKVVAYRK